MRIIGLSGRCGSGKTEVAQRFATILEDQLQVGPWELVAFAQPVKNHAAAIMGTTVDFLEQWKNNPEPPPGWRKNARELYEHIGNGCRTFNPDIWVNLLFKRFKKDGNYLIQDVRYPNEANRITAEGGLVIRRWRRSVPARDSECENAMDEWDTVLQRALMDRLDYSGPLQPNWLTQDGERKVKFDYLINDFSTIEELDDYLRSTVSDYVGNRLKYFTLV